ncbi:rRNA small subunit methyltransferase I [hydrothermal vent metagenome]|uniref:rRNA small subunit methyltransferase I n=1 Tax=hydrothermal vent metagenome TaxID=652676 RepID=A0A1W1CUY6_9ZZZZ
MLFVVATPIGNLEDITFRAIETLKSVDCILAEDTRHSQKLLSHYQITTKIQSFHEHNEREKTDVIIKQIQQGKSFALISDAGTPLISDPGFILISQAKKQNISVIPIPGVSAAITALCASGLNVNQFSFIGFLPSKKQQRKNNLKILKNRSETLILYESPKRIVDLLIDIAEIYNKNHIICLAKELTKTFETIITKPVSELIKWLNEDIQRQKGEFVVLIHSQVKSNYTDESIYHLTQCLSTELAPAKVAKMVAKITGLSKKECYQLTQNNE